MDDSREASFLRGVTAWLDDQRGKIAATIVMGVVVGGFTLESRISRLEYDSERFREFMGSGGRCTYDDCQAIRGELAHLHQDIRDIRSNDEQVMREVSRLEADVDRNKETMRDLTRGK